MSAPSEVVGRATAAAQVLTAARALEATGRHVVHLEVGEPDAPTAEHIVEAGVRAMRDGHTRYAPPAGIQELRAAVAVALRERGVAADAERVVVTPGAKAMLFTTLLASVRPGDEVLVPDPGYPMYAAAVELAGGRAVRYALREAGGFAVDADEVGSRVTARTRAIVLNAPHNPTGGIVDDVTLGRIAELAVRHDLLVVSDEIYSRHRYEGAAGGVQPSIAALPGMAERTVLVDGFSKTYAMTGWRLGYGVLPRRLVKPVTALVTNSVTCTATFVQHAGVAALVGPQDGVARQVAALAARRQQFVAELGRIDGVRCGLPSGAFYAFPNVAGALEGSGRTVAWLAHSLLHDHGLACLPGTAFGPGGEGHLRLSYAASATDLSLAVERLAAGLSSLGEKRERGFPRIP